MKTKTDNTETVIVLFRIDRSGTDRQITAVFPELETCSGFMTCYAHVGQHGSCSLGWMHGSTRPATPAEYKALAAELRSIGYNLIIRKRRPARCRLG
jgi:hypothetical protein